MSAYQYTFALLGNLLLDKEMIYLCLVQFTKNDDLIKPCKKWEDLPANAPLYNDVCRIMIK